MLKAPFVGAVVVLLISASGAAQTHRTAIVHERDLSWSSPPRRQHRQRSPGHDHRLQSAVTGVRCTTTMNDVECRHLPAGIAAIVADSEGPRSTRCPR